jgi:hypothetical protein
MNSQLQFIKDSANLNIDISNKTSGNVINISNDLHTRLNAILKNTLGDKIYTCDISPENLMSYRNGKISSLIKSGHEISGHYGFDVISVVNITDMLINDINASLVNEIINNFNKTAFEIINSIKILEYQMYNQIIKMKENEYADEIASYKSLLEEISGEIGIISITPDRKIPYITNIVDMRRKIYKIYEYYLRKLNNSGSTICVKDMFGNYPYINFTELNSDVCFTRQIISSYMIALIYEYLLSGNIDSKSKGIIVDKIKNFIERYNSVYQTINENLSQRHEDNKLYYWRSDKAVDSSNINWLLNNINNDQNFELTVIDDVFKNINDYLHNIILISV